MTDIVEREAVEAPPRPYNRRPWLIAGAVVALALIAVLGWQWTNPGGADPYGGLGTDVVSQEEMKARYGFTVDSISVTADGGLIDIRMSIFDVDKAIRLFREPLAFIIAEDSGLRIGSDAGHIHSPSLQPGGKYFLLYPNTQNAVVPGRPVSFVLAEAKITHIRAR